MQHPSRLLFSLFTCDSFITGKNAEILRTQLKKSPKKVAHRIVWLDPPWIHGWIPVEESLTNSSQVPVEMNPKLLSWTDSMLIVIQSYRKSVINSVLIMALNRGIEIPGTPVNILLRRFTQKNYGKSPVATRMIQISIHYPSISEN